MSVTSCRDDSDAEWVTGPGSAWDQLVRLGPGGFQRYARLRFLPDPDHPGQRENEAGDSLFFASEIDQLRIAAQVLRQHTSTPDACVFALWDGWGVIPTGDATRPVWHLPHRDYFLFRGPLDALGDEARWRSVVHEPGRRWWLPVPAFVWPQDKSWCLSRDVDPHYAGIAGEANAVEDLLAHGLVDVVAHDPLVVPPHYE